ncbi:MAG: hypothetical protein ACI9Y1_001181 [Lentisphaeria bacterium]|jgi:hypothetical protein
MGKTSKILSLSGLLVHLCSFAMVFVLASVAFSWLVLINEGPSSAFNMPVSFSLERTEIWQWIVGGVVTLIPAATRIYGLLHLRRLMRLYSEGQYFTAHAINHLYRFCFYMFASALANLVLHPVLSVVLTISNPPGQRALSFQLNSQTFSTLFIAAVFLVIAGIMHEASKIAEENAEII